MSAYKWLSLCLVLSTTAAHAGAQGHYVVTVGPLFTDQTFASGSIAAAQASSDSTASIGCVVVWESLDVPTATVRKLLCMARTSANVYAQCLTINPSQALVDMVLSLRDTDQLYFNYKNNTGYCQQIEVNRQSVQIRPSGSASLANAQAVAPGSPSAQPNVERK